MYGEEGGEGAREAQTGARGRTEGNPRPRQSSSPGRRNGWPRGGVRRWLFTVYPFVSFEFHTA